MVMAVVTPQTDVYLLKCPLEIDQQNQLTFANATAQYNYFIGLPHTPAIADNDFTYQRKDGVMRYPAHIDDIRSYNYCMYRNDAYSNKWFFAFIESMSYLNDQVTSIRLKTDIWQSWQFDFVFKRSFVEREHVNDDTIGAHTLDENLSVGEPICNGVVDYTIATNNAEDQRVVMQVTEMPETLLTWLKSNPQYNTRVYNGIAQGCYFCVFVSKAYLQNFIRWYDKNDKSNAILSIFLVPSTMVSNTYYKNFTVDTADDTQVGFLPQSFDPSSFPIAEVTYSASLDGYVPKNNKMYCYPFSYLYASNNVGSDILYRYEDWNDPTDPIFRVRGTIGQGCSIQAFPTNYKRLTAGGSYGAYGINCSKLPILSWLSDYYLNWQAQNGVNNIVQAGLGIVSGIGTAAGGLINVATSSSDSGTGHGVIQATQGGVDVIRSINSAMHEDWKASLVPDQAKGNTNCAELTYSMDKCGFTFRKMSCRRDYAIMCDNYFSMFGYKVNDLKIPNITGRTNWNYVKTRMCNVIGNIPQEDIDEMKSIMNSGITFWHNPATYLDYSQNNAIV